MNYLKNFWNANRAKFEIAGVGLIFAVGDALIGLADTNQHISLAQAAATGVGAAFLYLRTLYHSERAKIVSEALVQATLPQAQPQEPDKQ